MTLTVHTSPGELRGRARLVRRAAARRAALLLATALAAALAAGVPAASAQTEITATVGATPVGQMMPTGFVGISAEYDAIHAYTGRDPRAVNPVLVALLKALSPGGAPVVRIGGDSTDWTWWPQRGVIRPPGISYMLNKGWMRTTRALAQDAGAKLILGINLASDRPHLAAMEARALLHGIGRANVTGLEIGNEPDLYGVFPWYRDLRNQVGFSRRRYTFRAYLGDFNRWRAALPRFPVVGPAFSSLSWMPYLPQFLGTERSLGMVTFHRYPLRACVTDPIAAGFPSIPNLMTDAASAGLAQSLEPYVAMAHAHRLPFRLDELNSASCRGRRGVSDTFSSALWVLDTLFNLAAVGVDGVNLHTLPGAGYELATYTDTATGWQALVHPIYYGALMFVQAFPAGARLLPITAPGGAVKVWATAAPDGHQRIVIINKDPADPATVQLALPGTGGPATVEALTAPTLDATTGVTLGDQTFGTATTTGTLPGPPTTTVLQPAPDGSYSVDVPAASAALITR